MTPVSPLSPGTAAVPAPTRVRAHRPVQSLRSLAAALLLGVGLVSLARAEVQIERAFLPHGASPSSFAIGLPGGVNFCFDPLRSAVSYAWTGDFLDLSATRPGPGKFIAAARLLGPLAYQESGVAPLRRGDPARVPVIEFTGYSLRPDAIEFRYTVDGVPVREEIRARPDGTALIRKLQLGTGTDARWWQVLDGRPPLELKADSSDTLVIELPLRKAAP